MNIFIEKSCMTQFYHLINYKEHRIFNDYDIAVVDGLIETNIDLFIIGNHTTYNKLQEYGTEFMKKVVFSRRTNKSITLAQINSIIAKESLSNFVSLDVIGSSLHDMAQYPVLCDSKYFVKLELGARSLNMFIVDNHITPVPYVLQTLNNARNSSKESYKTTIDHLNSLVGVQYIEGNTRSDTEIFDSNSMQHFAHQEMRNILKEYRVIQSGHGKFISVFERVRNSENNGVVDNESNYTYETFALPNTILEDLQVIIKGLGEFFHGSIDLVESVEGQYAIVETSNQYGAADLPNRCKANLLSEAIDCAIEQVKINE